MAPNSPTPPVLLPPHIPIEEERIDHYNAKIFYPVQIGEVFNGAYKVATKLGFGGNSTVWLARDIRRYVCPCLIDATEF